MVIRSCKEQDSARLKCCCSVGRTLRAYSVVCGKGNNAGDGYVVARIALQFGLRVQVLAVADAVELVGDAALAYQAFVESGAKRMRLICRFDMV